MYLVVMAVGFSRRPEDYELLTEDGAIKVQGTFVESGEGTVTMGSSQRYRYLVHHGRDLDRRNGLLRVDRLQGSRAHEEQRMRPTVCRFKASFRRYHLFALLGLHV